MLYKLVDGFLNLNHIEYISDIKKHNKISAESPLHDLLPKDSTLFNDYYYFTLKGISGAEYEIDDTDFDKISNQLDKIKNFVNKETC